MSLRFGSLSRMNGNPKSQRPRIELEPELEIQVIGADADTVLSMAKTYYRWSKQLFVKLRISFPERAASHEARRRERGPGHQARRSAGSRK